MSDSLRRRGPELGGGGPWGPLEGACPMGPSTKPGGSGSGGSGGGGGGGGGDSDTCRHDIAQLLAFENILLSIF